MSELGKGFMLGIIVSFFVLLGVLYTINSNKEKIVKAQVQSFMDKKLDSIIESKGPWIDSLVMVKYNKMMQDTSVQRKITSVKGKIVNIFIDKK